METTVNQRLKIYFTSQNMTNASSIARTVNTTPQTISNLLAGETSPRVELVEAICNAYPDLNPTWLITGHGEMTFTGKVSNKSEGLAEKFIKALEQEVEDLKQDKERLWKVLMNLTGKAPLGKMLSDLLAQEEKSPLQISQAA